MVENANLYSQVRSTAVLEERKLLSCEMHDNLSQEFGLLNMQAAVYAVKEGLLEVKAS